MLVHVHLCKWYMPALVLCMLFFAHVYACSYARIHVCMCMLLTSMCARMYVYMPTAALVYQDCADDLYVSICRDVGTLVTSTILLYVYMNEWSSTTSFIMLMHNKTRMYVCIQHVNIRLFMYVCIHVPIRKTQAPSDFVFCFYLYISNLFDIRMLTYTRDVCMFLRTLQTATCWHNFP
jgi:hypothetical protein